MYATVEVHNTRGFLDRRKYAEIDAAYMKYLDGTLSVREPLIVAPDNAVFYNILGLEVSRPRTGLVRHLGANRYLVGGQR
jgi:hypothetical protein